MVPTTEIQARQRSGASQTINAEGSKSNGSTAARSGEAFPETSAVHSTRARALSPAILSLEKDGVTANEKNQALETNASSAAPTSKTQQSSTVKTARPRPKAPPPTKHQLCPKENKVGCPQAWPNGKCEYIHSWQMHEYGDEFEYEKLPWQQDDMMDLSRARFTGHIRGAVPRERDWWAWRKK